MNVSWTAEPAERPCLCKKHLPKKIAQKQRRNGLGKKRFERPGNSICFILLARACFWCLALEFLDRFAMGFLRLSLSHWKKQNLFKHSLFPFFIFWPVCKYKNAFYSVWSQVDDSTTIVQHASDWIVVNWHYWCTVQCRMIAKGLVMRNCFKTKTMYHMTTIKIFVTTHILFIQYTAHL